MAPSRVAPGLFHGNLSESNALDGGPDDRQATHLGREDINLIGALAHIAKKTLNGVGSADRAMHRLREVVKGQGFVFLLAQTPDGLGIELAIFGFEGGKLDQGCLLGRLSLDAQQFRLDLVTYSPGDGIQDVALLMRAFSADEGWLNTVPRPVLATCGIRWPAWACENTSCCRLLLADSSEEEYNLRHYFAQLHKGVIDTAHGILTFFKRLIGLYLQSHHYRFVTWSKPDTTSLLLGTQHLLNRNSPQRRGVLDSGDDQGQPTLMCPTGIPCSQHRLDGVRNRWFGSAIYAWGLLGRGLKAI
jgi:hypothetical protein